MNQGVFIYTKLITSIYQIKIHEIIRGKETKITDDKDRGLFIPFNDQVIETGLAVGFRQLLYNLSESNSTVLITSSSLSLIGNGQNCPLQPYSCKTFSYRPNDRSVIVAVIGWSRITLVGRS